VSLPLDQGDLLERQIEAADRRVGSLLDLPSSPTEARSL
jgi:hypothetical protein